MLFNQISSIIYINCIINILKKKIKKKNMKLSSSKLIEIPNFDNNNEVAKGYSYLIMTYNLSKFFLEFEMLGEFSDS